MAEVEFAYFGVPSLFTEYMSEYQLLFIVEWDGSVVSQMGPKL